ncbi:MAG: glycosyltransferase family 4 protein [Rhodocyclaceae bacterium]|nr:glycosyltransferase family 4 protein [Rhodocyclaceae bacterium]MCB1963856.1 glycosyltransferase family 4 protein [Rhodocyclaceae bacterium]
MALWLLPVLAVVAFGLTALVRRYALSRQLLDVPNARSSHVAPTPRGGGVSIVLCFLGSVPLLVGAGGLTAAWGWALAGAGGGVALVGFLDDHGHIPARWRLLAHFAAAFWALWLAAASMPLAVGGAWLGVGLSAFYLVWMLNLYNFMDGIDGIASVEAITVCAGAALIYWLRGDAPAVLMPPLALAAAVAGFLVWNFPPAKIFMGDAGSGFLGIVLGVLSLQAGAVSPALFWSWVILLGVFIVDATYTLLRRLLRGERVYEAHRSHAYQHASRRFASHRTVTLGVVAINVLWLLPWAVAVGLGWVGAGTGLVLAYLPLALVCRFFDAGAAERVRPQ